MGQRILSFLKTKIMKEDKCAFCSTFIITLLIHFYKFTNILLNTSSIYNYYSSQNMLSSGKWALSWACGISSYYDLPWVNGLMSALFISLTVVVIVRLFKIKNQVLICLTGAIIASSPSTTETFFNMYLADGYMIAMFLASLAVYFSRIEEDRISRHILSVLCICFTCAIYEYYVSFALILGILYFVDNLMLNNYSKENCLKWLRLQAIIYIGSIISYFAIWYLYMFIAGTSTKNYFGIFGAMSFESLTTGYENTLDALNRYFMQWEISEYGLTLYGLLNIMFGIIFALGLLIAIGKSEIYKRKWAFYLSIICLVAIVPFSCIWNFTSSVYYQSIMLQCLSLLFIFGALMYERWTKSFIKDIVCLFLVFVILNNSLMTNISYFSMNNCYERTYAEGLEILMEIHDYQDEYEVEEIAIIGSRRTELRYQKSDSKIDNFNQVYVLTGKLIKSLIIDSDHTLKFLDSTFGFTIKSADSSEINEIKQSDEFKEMNNWPAKNSIKMIDNILVIKFSN